METIGFIGLGIMGKPMALHILKAGYTLSVLSQLSNADEGSSPSLNQPNSETATFKPSPIT